MNTIAMTSEEKIRLLGLCPVFARIPRDVLAVLAEMMQTEAFAAGEKLFDASEASDRVFVVAAGELGVYPPGRPQPVRTLTAGDLLGEYGMFDALARTAAVKAETPAVLLSLDYGRFEAFLFHYPQAALVLLRTAVRRLVAAEAALGKK